MVGAEKLKKAGYKDFFWICPHCGMRFDYFGDALQERRGFKVIATVKDLTLEPGKDIRYYEIECGRCHRIFRLG